MVHTSASERSSASMPSSFEAEMPLRRVMPGQGGAGRRPEGRARRPRVARSQSGQGAAAVQAAAEAAVQAAAAAAAAARWA